MNDLLIRRARLIDGSEAVDVAIKDGYIVACGENVAGSARQMVDAAGRLLIPAFVDAHIHLDSALTVPAGLEDFDEFDHRDHYIGKNDFIYRGRRLMDMALSHGTTAIRSHVTVNSSLALKAIEAALELKEEYTGKVDLQVIATTNEFFPTRHLKELLREALRLGADGVGSFPCRQEEVRTWVDLIAGIAETNEAFIDFHIDDKNGNGVECLEYIAEKTINTGYHGKVTVDYCYGLGTVDDVTASHAVASIREARINVTIIPTAILFFKNRRNKYSVFQNIKRIKELMAAGVNIAYASGNIRDEICPFGNANMLEEALVTALFLQLGTAAELEQVMIMGTYNAAAAIGLNNYGVDVEAKADLVILDTTSPSEAVIGQVEKVCIIKDGRVAVRNDRKIDYII